MVDGIDNSLGNSLFRQVPEKTFIDKILGRQDVEAVRGIIRKDSLTRADYLEILYLLNSVESKLYNYTAWDRYILAKFVVWIRELVSVAEMLFDYEDDITKKGVELSSTSDKLFKNIKRLVEHDIKFLIDLYFNISRTTMSIGAHGFDEILKNKQEMVYTHQETNEKKGFLGFGGKK